MAVQFFGEVDRDARGTITSSYPAWYQENLVINLEEQIHDIETRMRHMAEGKVREDQLPKLKMELRKLKGRYDEIVSTRPSLSDQDKDRLQKMREELGKEIGESMFAYSDMMRGTADAHQEYRRMKNPCIKLDGEIAEDMGIKLGAEGKVGRDTALRAFKIMSRALGEDPNPELLRRRYQKEF